MKNLSPRAKKILTVLAQDEARKLGSKQLLPEHVILAMLKYKSGLGCSVFPKLLLDASDLKKILDKYFEEDLNPPNLNRIPFSQRYRQLMNIADIEASALHNEYIGTEHLLLAAVREENSIVHRFFAISDYSIMDLRFVVMELQSEEKTSFYQQENENILDAVFRSIFTDMSSVWENDEADTRKSQPVTEDKS